MRRVLLIIVLLTLSLSLGCSQEKSQPVQTQGQQQVQQQTATPAPPASTEFSFRGIKLGTPLSEFKECVRDPTFTTAIPKNEDLCYWSEKNTHMFFTLTDTEQFAKSVFKNELKNLPKLDFSTSEYIAVIDNKIESMIVTFKNEFSQKMYDMLKSKYGQEKEAFVNPVQLSNGMTVKQQLAIWDINGYRIELTNIRNRADDDGRIFVKSQVYLQKEAAYKKSQTDKL